MNKTLKHSMGTKALSFLLAFIMTFSTLAVGITPMMDIFASGALSKSSYTQPTIKIAVPETIYLTPAASASKFEYFLNNNTNGAAYNYDTSDNQTGYDSKGYIEFTCTDFANKNITVTSSDFKKSGESVNATYSKTASSAGTVTFDIAKDGTLNSAIAAGTTSTITWIFTDESGNVIAKAYTTVYAPSLMTVATEVARKRAATSVGAGDRAMANGTVWITGITSYNNNASGGGDGDYIGVYRSTPLTETWTDGTRSTCVATTSCGNDNKDPGSSDFAYNDTGNGFVGYWQRKSDSGTSPYTGRFAGEIVVDWSRTNSNLNQIPNLITGVDIQEQWDANQKGNGTVSLDIGSTNLRVSGNTARYSNKQNYQGFRFSSSFNFSITSQPTSATVTATITARVATSKPSTVLNISYVNKSSLRSAVQTAVNAGYHPEWYTTDTWNAYNAALINACRVLGRPDVTAGELTTAESNLSAAKSALSRSGITGTLKATHKTPSKTLGTDTDVTYSLGDITTATQNTYTGYKCTGYTVSKTTRAITTNTVNENLFNVANFASRIKNASCSKITWAVAGTGMAFLGTGTDNYTGPYDKANNTYIIQVTPGATYTYSFTTDQTNYRHFIFSYSSDAVGYTTAYEINSSSATSGLTNVVRQKVGTVWNVSVDYTVPSGINYLGFRFGTNTKNTLNGTNNITFIKKNSSSSTTAQTLSGSSSNTSETITNNCYTETSYVFNYEPITYTISYDLEGGTVATANPETYNVESNAITLSNPTKTGYTFAGWTGTGLSSATKTVTIEKGSTGNREYTANWTPNTYTVTYNVNGGNALSPASKTVTYDSAYGTLPTPTRTGYDFDGWFTAASGGTQVTKDSILKSEGTTIYAHWTIHTSTLTVKPNGGSWNGSASEQSFTQNYNTTKDIPVPTRTGYTFTGWTKSESFNGNLSSTTGAATYTFGSAKGVTDTITANWSANTYEIGYDNLFFFGEWASKSGELYQPNGNTISVDREKGEFSVTTGASGKNDIYTKYSSGNDYSIKVEPNTEYVLRYDVEFSGANAVKQGQAFVFFYKDDFSEDITGGKVASLESKYDKLATLEATGNPFADNYPTENGTYVIAFKTGANTEYIQFRFGGTQFNQTVKFSKIGVYEKSVYDRVLFDNPLYEEVRKAYVYAEGGTFSGIYNPYKAGFKFDGWYEDKDFTEQVKDGTALFPHNTTLYSKWIHLDYSIDYELGGGTNNADNPTQYSIDDAPYLTFKDPTKTGYTFTGWTVDENVTLVDDRKTYNSWESGSTDFLSYTIRAPFKENDVYELKFKIKGSGTVTDYFYGKYVNENDHYISVKDIYVNGSLYSHSGDGSNYITLTNDFTEYTIRFTLGNDGNPNYDKYIMFRVQGGATATVKDVVVSKVSEEIDDDPNAASIQYKFSTARAISNLTLTAHWVLTPYTLTFVTGEGGSTVNPISYNFTQTINLPARPTRNGYTFKEWKVTSNTDGYWVKDSVHPAGEAVPVGTLGNATLTAQWLDKAKLIEAKAYAEACFDKTGITDTGSKWESPYYTQAILDKFKGRYDDICRIINSNDIINTAGHSGYTVNENDYIMDTQAEYDEFAGEFKENIDSLKFKAITSQNYDKEGFLSSTYTLGAASSTAGSQFPTVTYDPTTGIITLNGKFNAVSSKSKKVVTIDLESSQTSAAVIYQYISGGASFNGQSSSDSLQNSSGALADMCFELVNQSESSVPDTGRYDPCWDSATRSHLDLATEIFAPRIRIAEAKEKGPYQKLKVYIYSSTNGEVTFNNYKFKVQVRSVNDVKRCYPADIASELSLSGTVYSRTAYDFKGWDTDPTYTGDGLSVDDLKKESKNFPNSANSVVANAIWKPTVYTLTYDAAGGIIPGTAGTDYTETYTILDSVKLPAPTKTGYTFNGWKVTTAAGNWKTSDSNYSETVATGKYGNAKLTAQWTPITYTVNYVLDGGSFGTNPPASATFDTPFAVSKPTRATFKFVGWEISGAGFDAVTAKYGTSEDAIDTGITKDTAFGEDNNTLYFKNLSSTSGGVITFTAKWKDDAEPSARIEYTNGGVKSSQEVNLVASDNVGITGYYWGQSTSPVFTPVDPAVLDWSKKETVSEPGTYYFKVKDKIFTVTRSIIFYQTTFNQNYAGAPEATYSINKSGDKIKSIPTRLGYTFEGWYAESGCINRVDSSSDKGAIDVSSTRTLYAKWELIPLDANYYDDVFSLVAFKDELQASENPVFTVDTANGTVKADYSVIDTKKYYSNSPYKIALKPSTEYKFSYKQNASDSKTWADIQIDFYDADGNSLNAEFAVNGKLSNTYGEDGKSSYISFYNNTENKLRSTGVHTSLDNSSVAGADGKTYLKFTTPEECAYAIINFGMDSESAAGTEVSVTFSDISLCETASTAHREYNVESTVDGADMLVAAPERTGYTLDSWIIANDGSVLSSGTDLSKYYEGMTLISKYKPNVYTVEYDGNGANDGSTAPSTHTYDMTQPLAENGFTKGFTISYNYYGGTAQADSGSGSYTFDGWATSKDGPVVYSKNDGTYNVKNLTAVNGGSVTLFAKWTEASVTLPTPTKKGYLFDGWYSDDSFTTLVGFGGDSYTATGAVILHAKWIPVPLDVTYDEQFDMSQFLNSISATGTSSSRFGLYNSAEIENGALKLTGSNTSATDSTYKVKVEPNKGYFLKFTQKLGDNTAWASPTVTFWNDDETVAVAHDTQIHYKGDIIEHFLPANDGDINTTNHTINDVSFILLYGENGNKAYQWSFDDWGDKYSQEYDTVMSGLSASEGLNIDSNGYGEAGIYFITPPGTKYVSVNFRFQTKESGDKTYYTDSAWVKDISLKRVEHYTLPEQVAGGEFTGTVYRSVEDYNIIPPARDGYTFKYWIDTATGEKFDQSKLNEYLEGVTLESFWTENIYTVHFDGNGNTNTGASIADITGKKYTDKFTLPENVFEKTGWYFEGWSANKNAKADDDGVYSAGELVSMLAAKDKETDEITLYAVWTRIRYTIQYHGEGSLTAEDQDTYTQNREYGDEKSLVNNFLSKEIVNFVYGDEGADVDPRYKCKEGTNPKTANVSYNLNGWARTSGGTVAYANNFKGDLYKENGDFLEHESTVDLYPSWDARISITLPTPEREGLDLIGWYTEGNWDEIERDRQYQNMLCLWNLIAEEKKYPEFAKGAMPEGWGESVTEPQVPEDFISSYNGNINDLDKQELWNLIADVKKYPEFVKDAMPDNWGIMYPQVPEDFTYDGDISKLSMSELWNLIAEQGFDGFVKDAKPEGWGEMIPQIPEDFNYDGEIDVQSKYYVGKGGETVAMENPGTLYAMWQDTTDPDITVNNVTNNFANQQTVSFTFGDAGKLDRYYFGTNIAAPAKDYIAFADDIINTTVSCTVSEAGTYYLNLYDKSGNSDYMTFRFYKTEFDGERSANENVATVLTYEGNAVTFNDTVKKIIRTGYNFNGWFESETYAGTAYMDSYTPVKNTVLHAGWTPNMILFNEYKSVDNISNLIAPAWNTSFAGLTVTKDNESEIINANGTQTDDAVLFTSPFDPTAETDYRITVEFLSGTVEGDGYIAVEFTTTSGEALGEDIKYIYDYSIGANGSAVLRFNSEQAGKIGGIKVLMCNGTGNTFSDYKFRIKLEKASAGAAYEYSKNAAHINKSNADIRASLPTPEKTGYTFVGWSAAVNGEVISEDYNFNGITGTQTFYAKWQANSYTVIYQGGDANVEHPEYSQDCTYDKDFRLLANEYERKFEVKFEPGCNDATIEGTQDPIKGLIEALEAIEVVSTFAGWLNTKTGEVYTNLESLRKNLTSEPDGTVYLVAQWKDTEITLPTAERPVGPAGEKYNLQGWFESEADNAKRLGGAGTKYTVSANIIFFAKWTPVDIKDKNVAYDFAEKTTFSVIDVNGFDIIPANIDAAKVSIGSSLKELDLIHMPTTASNINEGFADRSYSVKFLNNNNESTNLTFNIDVGEDDENYTKFKNALTQQSTALFLSGSDSFSGTATFYFEFAFIAESETDWQYITGQVDIVPANSVYYEETVFAANDTMSGENYGSEWTVEGTNNLITTAETIEYQAYGYSREYRNSMTYSAGTAVKADVSEFRPSSMIKEFKFNGMGFELVSDCGPNTSALMIYVWKLVNGEYRLFANAVVDTRITDANLTAGGLIKQVPVYHFLSTERANYLVQVCAIYVETELSKDVVQGSKAFNELTDELEEIGVEVDEKLLEVKSMSEEVTETQTEETVFNRYAPTDVLKAVTAEQRLLGTGEDKSTGYIDGIRVYKPTEDESKYYSWEKDATFFNILQRTRDAAGALTEYKVDGQNDMIDEIYLAPKAGDNISSTAFSIDGFESGKNRIMVSLRAVDQKTEIYVSGGEGSTGKIVLDVDHSTEMYYDITDAVVNGTVVISNNGNGYAAVCNLKVTVDDGMINVTPLAPQKIEGVRNMLASVASLRNIAYTPLVEPKPQKEEQGEQGEQGENPPSGGTASVKIFKFEKSTNSVEVEYRSTVKFYAVEETIPEGAKLCWYLNGKRDYASDGKETIVLTELKEQTAVQAKILGEDDSTLAESGKVTVKVKGGFFQMLIAFIRGLFKKLPVYDFKPNK